MWRNTRYKFGVLLIAIAMLLTACGSPSPSSSIQTATPISPGTATPAGTPASAPITGSVLIEGGSSMAGGTAGDTIELSIEFTANSTAGSVREMRVDTGAFGCLDETALAPQPWQPFIAEQIYTTTASINIQGWYVSAQYRDDAGNTSSVYCDDISIEGMPPAPTP